MKRHLASLCSLALALWGFQTGLLLCAIPMILLLEGRHFIRRRWDVPLQDLKRLAQLCSLIFTVFLIFLFITQLSFSLIYRLLQWLPICVFPFVAAQTYATHFSTPFRRLFSNCFTARARNSPKSINLYYPYFALCLLAASATNWNSLFFYGAATALIALLLWSLRPQHSAPILWVCLLLLASGIGFLGHLQLHQLQTQLEKQTAPWLQGLIGESVDPYQAITEIGSMGSLKQSNAIVFRVTGDRSSFPLLLQEATYNQYSSGSWAALKSQFKSVRAQSDGTWPLGKTNLQSSAIRVTAHLNEGQGILRLPAGTSEIKQLPVQQLKQNQYGTVKAAGKSGTIGYQAQFNPAQSFAVPPTAADLYIPKTEQAAIEQTLQTLAITEKSEAEVVQQISSFFQNNFQYSLEFAQPQTSTTPLSAFLLDQRSGHCEYFASATTLLLRGARIPARYVVGYSVHEFSPMEQQYIVRSRHAHAWTMAYINRVWQAIDTTPADWTAQENAKASPLQVLSDLWSFAILQLSTGLQQLTQKIGWLSITLVAPILFFGLWKWGRTFRRGRSRIPHLTSSAPSHPVIKTGLDSEFYLLEKRLQELDLQRINTESLQQWITRLQTQLSTPQVEALKQIMTLHYRYRFDPQGIKPTERETLRALSHDLIKKLPVLSP